MKNILIPVDFSEGSMIAAKYAIELSKTLKARISYLHVYHIPMITSEAAVVVPDFNNLEKESADALNKLEEELRVKYGTEKADCIVRPGFLIDEMKDVVKEKNIDLIIMGITGAGKLSELLIGSNTTIAINNVDCPILVIPKDCVYKPIKNIAFACDFIKVKETPAIDSIKSIATIFNAGIHIINMVTPDEKPNAKKAIEGIKLEAIFDNLKHSLHFPENDDLVYVINDFVEKHSIDLLIMIPRKHNIFSSIFKESNTKKMAFHTHIPLLTIHD